MKKEIDFTKPLQTVSGFPVRVLATDVKTDGGRPIVVAIETHPGREVICLYGKDGIHEIKDWCLVNVPQKKYANVYRHSCSFSVGGGVFFSMGCGVYDTLEEAQEKATIDYVKTIEFEL